MRLALIYALLESSETIKTQHLKAAHAVWDYCFASAQFIFDGKSAPAKFIFGGESPGKLKDRLRSMLKSKTNGMTRTEISGALQHHASSDSIDRALRGLWDSDDVESRTESTRGRPVHRWVYVDKED